MKKSLMLVLMLGLVAVMLGGCRKPPMLEKFKEVKNNETAFVLSLEGDMSNQGKMKSLEQLQKAKVAVKRINIPLRYQKTGRWWYQAKLIPTVMIITVDRTPMTREWIAAEDKGSNRKDDAIWIESSDSVTFSTGFTVTAMIEEENSALFLYKYTNSSLANVMDKEIRARIQARSAEVATKYNMDELREKKMEIIEAVKADIIPYFADRGVTITTLGMFGGFNYENPDIQQSIDKVFITQQEKENAKAMLEAQTDKNARIKLEATAFADAEIEKAKGKAQAIEIEAKAEAGAITAVAEAAEKAKSNPVFVTLKNIAVEEQRIEKWNGQYPNWYMSSGMGENDIDILVSPPQN